MMDTGAAQFHDRCQGGPKARRSRRASLSPICSMLGFPGLLHRPRRHWLRPHGTLRRARSDPRLLRVQLHGYSRFRPGVGRRIVRRHLLRCPHEHAVEGVLPRRTRKICSPVPACICMFRTTWLRGRVAAGVGPRSIRVDAAGSADSYSLNNAYGYRFQPGNRDRVCHSGGPCHVTARGVSTLQGS